MTSEVSLVTGAATGLVRAISIALAQRGDWSVLCDIDAGGLARIAGALHTREAEVVTLACDVSDPDGVAKVVSAGVAAFGSLDYAVNNAGIEGEQAPVVNYHLDEWRRVLSTNLDGIFLSIKAEIPELLRRGRGAIVNIGSTASLGGVDIMPAYTAAKHGLVGLTKSAGLAYADRNVRVNALCPGSFRMAMSERLFGNTMQSSIDATPRKRLEELEEIAAAAAFLCSDAASFITGVSLPVEGAKRAR